MIRELLLHLSRLYVDGVVSQEHINWDRQVSDNNSLKQWRYRVLKYISQVLCEGYKKGVIVLIDDMIPQCIPQ
jgi:hypothetical protein